MAPARYASWGRTLAERLVLVLSVGVASQCSLDTSSLVRQPQGNADGSPGDLDASSVLLDSSLPDGAPDATLGDASTCVLHHPPERPALPDTRPAGSEFAVAFGVVNITIPDPKDVGFDIDDVASMCSDTVTTPVSFACRPRIEGRNACDSTTPLGHCGVDNALGTLAATIPTVSRAVSNTIGAARVGRARTLLLLDDFNGTSRDDHVGVRFVISPGAPSAGGDGGIDGGLQDVPNDSTSMPSRWLLPATLPLPFDGYVVDSQLIVKFRPNDAIPMAFSGNVNDPMEVGQLTAYGGYLQADIRVMKGTTAEKLTSHPVADPSFLQLENMDVASTVSLDAVLSMITLSSPPLLATVSAQLLCGASDTMYPPSPKDSPRDLRCNGLSTALRMSMEPVSTVSGAPLYPIVDYSALPNQIAKYCP